VGKPVGGFPDAVERLEETPPRRWSHTTATWGARAPAPAQKRYSHPVYVDDRRLNRWRYRDVEMKLPSCGR